MFDDDFLHEIFRCSRTTTSVFCPKVAPKRWCYVHQQCAEVMNVHFYQVFEPLAKNMCAVRRIHFGAAVYVDPALRHGSSFILHKHRLAARV